MAANESRQKRKRKGRWFNREVFGWAMFDFANQAFTLVILTTMFQLYFVNHVATGYEAVPDPATADFTEKQSFGRQLWGTSVIISQVIVILISPLIGALADFSGAKKKLLFITYLGCVLFTASFGLLTPGAAALAMVLFIVGYVFYATGENFLGAFLPELTAHRHMGRVSAFGFTLGYIGGLCALIGAVFIGAMGSTVTGYRLITLWCAVFFLFAAVPTFVLLRERKQREEMPPGQTLLTVGFQRIAATFGSLRDFRHLFRFLAIMVFYIAGMQIVIFFGGSIATKLFGLTQAQLGIYILVSTVSAIAGAFITSLYQDRIGTRNTIIIALGLWTAIMIAAIFVRQSWQQYLAVQILFWVVGALVGFGMGVLGTSSRAMVGLFSPQHKSAEFFGFYGLSHKGAAILGLGLNLVAENVFQDYNLVVASSGVFFIGGILLMLTVDEKAGRIVAIRAAREHVRKHRDYLGEIPDDGAESQAVPPAKDAPPGTAARG